MCRWVTIFKKKTTVYSWLSKGLILVHPDCPERHSLLIQVEKAMVNDEVVKAQPGDFYGGWITDKIVGPFKGGQGSWGW